MNMDVLKHCNIEGDKIKTAPTGFINFTLFLSWLDFFSNYVPDSVARPLVLVYDGCCRYNSDEIVKKSVGLKIILVLFPANAIHLVQPLDKSIFKPFKSVFKKYVLDFTLENAITTISKKYAMTIASKSSRE